MPETYIFADPIVTLLGDWSAELNILSVTLRVFLSVLLSAIIGCEYTSGILLKHHNACPWDYSKAKFNYKGVIRLDYVPCWAAAGLLFERILCKK